MYELILAERFITVVATIIVAVLASSLVGARKLWAKGLIYNLTPAMAAAFYVVAYFGEPRPNSIDLIAGFLFEIIILVLFFRLFVKIKKDLVIISKEDCTSVLKWTLFLHIVISLPNMMTTGFGLFSEGSRIDYLSENSLAKYYTYAGFLIITIQAVFLASLVTCRGYLGILGWSAISVNMVLSVMAGSKGGVFLWIFSIVSLIDYKRAHIQTYKIIIAIMVVLIMAGISSLVVAEFFNLEFTDFIDLAISRFFLNNDARALSLDLRSSYTGELSFFSEAFRSLGNLFGLPPRNEPLGVVLYGEGLSIQNGSGANTSFMALSTYYFPIGYSILPALLGILFVTIFVEAAQIFTSKQFVRTSRRVMTTSIWLATLMIFSQDFLAFQILLPIAMLINFIIWITQFNIHSLTTKSQHDAA